MTIGLVPHRFAMYLSLISLFFLLGGQIFASHCHQLLFRSEVPVLYQ